jgi:N-acyl-D-aspartate/D-glutamate deacylase
VGCDCYPYAASSSTLDLKQVTDAHRITITWSTPHPEMGGRDLMDIAAEWNVSLLDAARQLQPAGAVYYGMDEADVRRILAHPLSMVGSDGLPEDPFPILVCGARSLGCSDISAAMRAVCCTPPCTNDRAVSGAIRFEGAGRDPRRTLGRPGVVRPGDYSRCGGLQ